MPALAEDVSVESSSKNATTEAEITGLREIEDGSVISNVHTSKWRVYTDNGRDYFIQASSIHVVWGIISDFSFSILSSCCITYG